MIIACLLGQPARCEAFHLPFATPQGIRTCMYQAQFRVLEWQVAMPDWAVKKWICGLPAT
ncbi:MAG: hypothetical protein HC871_00510 [Rhizobiales bacterium]|nr:hypothetical protein [Hyphomicrobiales bacterium]